MISVGCWILSDSRIEARRDGSGNIFVFLFLSLTGHYQVGEVRFWPPFLAVWLIDVGLLHLRPIFFRRYRRPFIVQFALLALDVCAV